MLDGRAFLDEVVADGQQELGRGEVGHRRRVGAERARVPSRSQGRSIGSKVTTWLGLLPERGEPGAKERAQATRLGAGEHDDQLASRRARA